MANFRNQTPLLCEHCGASMREGQGASRRRFCRTCTPDKRAHNRLITYGVSQPMFDAMYFEQDGRCAICQEAEGTHLDHDHSTGKPRGILCGSCNVKLSGVDNKQWLATALDYVRG